MVHLVISGFISIEMVSTGSPRNCEPEELCIPLAYHLKDIEVCSKLFKEWLKDKFGVDVEPELYLVQSYG